MARIVRRIGLSIGADICWSICYQEIVKRLALSIPDGGDRIEIEVQPVTIEPFELRRPCPYDVVIDRLTHWYHTTREWIKKAILLDGLYVFNNPWSVQSMEKQTTYCAMMRLGLPVPETWMVPPKEYEDTKDLKVTLEKYAQLFELADVGKALGYPMYMKPYDGGAWIGVSRIENEEALRTAYGASGRRIMHLQKAIEPYDCFVRAIGLGPQVRIVRYDPNAPLHDRYTTDREFLGQDDVSLLEAMTLTINTFFGWDFNSCEALRKDGVWHPIDFANACPDSQVTSLHYHFPWMVMAKVRWSVFCAVTRRRMRMTLDWQPYFDACEGITDLKDRVQACATIARQRLDADRFAEFCDRHLSHLDEVAYDFFASERARSAVREKVAALYPEHEIEEFTELFWRRVQDWRETEARPAGAGAPGQESV